MSEVRSIKMTPVLKGAAVIVVIAAGFLSWFTINRALGAMVAANTTSKEIADIGIGLAPDNAWTHFAAGVMLDKTFLPEDLVRSQEEFEKAVSLSPHDYRLWLELARSYEKNGNSEKAETAFRKTLELAPNYAQVQWTVGNFLLRQDKNDEAFELIRAAASKDFNLAASASAVAWNIYDGDLPRIRGYFGDSLNLRGGLAVFLAGQGKIDEAMEVWSTIPKEAMGGQLAPLGDALVKKLIDAKRYLLIVKFQELQNLNPPKPGEITNGGFEGAIYISGGGIFDWQFTDGEDVQIGVDPSQVRDGAKSTALMMILDSDGRSFRTVSQTVPVEPGVKYQFNVAYKSNIEYRPTMRWEIVNTVDSAIIGGTAALSEKTDWTSATAEFTVPDKTEGVLIRLVRLGCDSIICPLTGRVWFDDISLTPLKK